MDELDGARKESDDVLEQYLHEHILRGADRFVACQHVATTRKRDKKLEIAFAVREQWQTKDERVAAAVKDSVDALLAAFPRLNDVGVSWYTFEG